MAIVDPGQCPRGTGVGVDGGQLPVPVERGSAAGEAQERQRPGQPEREGQVLVGLLLPAAAPHGVEGLGEPEQVLAGAGREEMPDPVDHLEAPGRGLGRVEAEQGDDAVDVDQEEGTIHIPSIANA